MTAIKRIIASLILCAVLFPVSVTLESCRYNETSGGSSTDSNVYSTNDYTYESETPDSAATGSPAKSGDSIDAGLDKVKRRVVIDAPEQTDTLTEDAGVKMEVTGNSSQAVFLMITNCTDQIIQYGDGFQVFSKQWGSVGQADQVYYTLQPGEQQSTYSKVSNLGPGEFRITRNIIFGSEDPATEAPIEITAEFVIENKAIPADVRGVVMKADQDFAAPYGAFLEITNGFDNGRIFFDRYFWLQRYTDGIWEDIPPAGPDSFTYETYSLAPRQIMPLLIYWAWLYDDLPPGEYRAGKCFLHRADDGTDTQYDVYASFMLDGGPIPASVHRDYSDVGNPLSGVTAFRAVVEKHLGSEDYYVAHGGKGMLVESLTEFWNGWNAAGDPLFVYDSYSCSVLDLNNEHIGFSDIPRGAEIEITFSGMILASYPGILGGALLIRIVG